MSNWNWMQVTIAAEDAMGKPMIGPGGMTRDEAHAEVQSTLDRLAAHDLRFVDTAALWRRGAEDDTVFWNSLVLWTIYEYSGDDPLPASLVWLQGLADTMTAAGLNTQVAKLPPAAR